MEPQTYPRYRVLCAADASDVADAVVEHALAEAIKHDRAALHVVTVVARDDSEQIASALARLERLVRSKADIFPDRPGSDHKVHLHARAGRPAEEIVQLALEVEAQLVVVGGTLSGGRKPHLGQVAQAVVSEIPGPVLVVRVPDYEAHPLRAEQCPDCVRVRADSDGERWFCDKHHGEHALTSTIFIGNTQPSLRGGLML
jgi:nucleotide-binding universal stress UspA family protein